MAYRMYKSGFLPNGNSRGWLHESSKFIRVMLFIDDIMVKLRKEEEKNGQRE